MTCALGPEINEFQSRVNSKATLRVSLKAFLPLLPTLLHPAIESSRYHTEKSETLVIQSDANRKQSENAQECFRKLYAVVREAGKDMIPGETSTTDIEKWKKMQA